MSEEIKHPGWAVKFKSGSKSELWLSDYPHMGYNLGAYAEEATIFESKEDAEDTASRFFRKEYHASYPYKDYKDWYVIEAWEPAYHDLLMKFESLKKVAHVTPGNIYEVNDLIHELEEKLKEVKFEIQSWRK